MKKIISILIVAVLLLSSVVAMIPASAARLSYIPDWLDLKDRTMYAAYMPDGSSYDLAKFWEYFIVTREKNLLSPAVRADSAPECVYVSIVQFEITEDTKYQYDLKVKSNSVNNFGGAVFAMSPDNVAYSAYGGFNNSNHLNQEWADQSAIAIIHGRYTDREPYIGNEYMQDEKYFEELELDDEDFASLKIVYEGLNVTVYAKNIEGEFVQMAETVELIEGSTLAFGVFNRNSSSAQNRTVSIKDAKITALNEAAVEAMEMSGEDFGAAARIELEGLVDQVNTEYSKADYTEDSWAALEDALRQAELLLEENEVLDDELIIAKEDLEMALEDLVFVPVDATELKELIAKVKLLNKDKYNEISYNMLMKSVAEAEALLASQNGFKRSDVDAAMADINAKIKNLKDLSGNPAPFEPEAPETEPPATEPPATEPPATEPPATEPPATEPPATEPPATEPPATEPPVNKADLTAEINLGKRYNKDAWQGSAAAWEAFEQELASADALCNKADATQEEVDSMLDSLKSKREALKQTVNKTNLKSAIDTCKAVKSDDWQGDAAAWSAFAQELAAAEALYESEDALQEDVNNMVVSLQTKISALKHTADKTVLKAAIDSCKTINKDDWQGDVAAWTAFEQELATAEALYANINAAQEDVNNIVGSLNTKMQALRATPVATEPVTDPSTEPVTELPTDTATGTATDTATGTATGTDTQAPATQAPATQVSGGCGGAIVTTSIVVGIVTTLGAALVVKKKD